MPELVPHLRDRGSVGYVRVYQESLTVRDFNNGLQPVIIELSNGMKGHGTCLGCHDAPCMMLSEADMKLSESLAAFPGNPSREICPTQAITWDDSDEFTHVNSEACIGCGLCVARCPYGAISLSDQGVAVVEHDDLDDLTVEGANSTSPEEHPETLRIGRIGPIDSPSVREMPNSIAKMPNHVATRFIRNLLIECGMKTRTRRQGDTNIRIDGVLFTKDKDVGVLEIELGNDVLASPRALLEDVAVLHRRYGVEKENITPVSVVVELPNRRTEYFRVIDDIEKVLGLRCRTVTVGALLSMIWHFQRINGFTEGLFETSPDDSDLLPAMQRYVSESIPAIEPYPGAYRSSK